MSGVGVIRCFVMEANSMPAGASALAMMTDKGRGEKWYKWAGPSVNSMRNSFFIPTQHVQMLHEYKLDGVS